MPIWNQKGVYDGRLSSVNFVVTSGLVLHLDAGNPSSYPGTGTTWTDLSGNGINATLANVTYNSGNNGYLSFNGSSSSALMQNSTLLNNQTFTIESWFKTNVVNQSGFLFEKGNVNTQYSLFFDAGGLFYCRINNGAVVNCITPTTATYINTTSWYQIVFTFTSGSQVCYINGVSIGTGTSTGTVVTNDNGMSIGVYGGFNGARGYWFNGNIAITRIYNKVLSAAEVTQNYNVNKGRYGL